MTNEEIVAKHRKYRKDELAKSYGAQLEAFAETVRQASGKVHDGPPKQIAIKRTGPGSPKGAKFPLPNVFFVKSPPFEFGDPNPEYTIHTPGTAQGAFFNIVGFGDSARGRLSVGVSAGITRDADWTGDTFYSELPDRWLLGDAITSTASLSQVVNLARNFGTNETLNATVQFSWDLTHIVSAPNHYFLWSSVFNTPGLPNSAAQGLVCSGANVEVVVSLFDRDTIVSTEAVSQNILELGINAQNYGDTVQDKTAAPYLFLNFAFADDPFGSIELTAGAPYVAGAQSMVIETTLRLTGMRGGVNDPNAGYVTAAFLDVDQGVSPVSYVPFNSNPFRVSRITAFSSPS